MRHEVGLAAKRYILVLAALAVGSLTFAWLRGPWDASDSLPMTVALSSLMALAFCFPLPFDPDIQLHLDSAVILAAALSLEPRMALLAIALGALAANLALRHPWWQETFNASQATLQAAAACALLSVGGWDPQSPQFSDAGALLTVVIAGAAMHVVNLLAIGGVLAVGRGDSLLRGLTVDGIVLERTEVFGHAALLGLGVLAAIVVSAQPWALCLLLLPAVTIHAGLEQHVRLRHGTEARLAAAQRLANLGSWEWDLQGRSVVWSPEALSILGIASSQAYGGIEALLGTALEADRADLKSALDSGEQGAHVDLEFRIFRSTGTARHIHLIAETVRNRAGRPVRMLGTIHDITERKALEEALLFQASHDPLTELSNRRAFEEQTAQALARAGRRGTGVALLYLDLDSFKLVNDVHGHQAGDTLLKSVAERLRANLRLEDTVARRGGDEFTVLLQDLASSAEAERVARRLVAAFMTPLSIGSSDLVVGVSIGMAYCVGSSLTSDDLLHEADHALYEAKRDGGGRYRFARAPRRRGQAA